MLLADSPGPGTGADVLERLGLPESFERIAQHRIQQVEDPERHLAIRLHPPAEILKKSRGEESAIRSLPVAFATQNLAAQLLDAHLEALPTAGLVEREPEPFRIARRA